MAHRALILICAVCARFDLHQSILYPPDALYDVKDCVGFCELILDATVCLCGKCVSRLLQLVAPWHTCLSLLCSTDWRTIDDTHDKLFVCCCLLRWHRLQFQWTVLLSLSLYLGCVSSLIYCWCHSFESHLFVGTPTNRRQANTKVNTLSSCLMQ